MNKDLHLRALELQRQRVQEIEDEVKFFGDCDYAKDLEPERYILQTLEKLSDEKL